MARITAREALKEARRLGVKLSLGHFWRMYRLGVLPEGERSTHGQELHFPEYTPELLYALCVARHLGLSLSKVDSIEVSRTAILVHQAVSRGLRLPSLNEFATKLETPFHSHQWVLFNVLLTQLLKQTLEEQHSASREPSHSS